MPCRAAPGSDAMLDALRRTLALPDWVGLSSLRIDPDGIAQATRTLPPRAAQTLAGLTANMADKRRNEFVAGRVCAARALHGAGVRAADMPADGILPIDGRLPVWPAGWVGSISHGNRWAIAGAASASRCEGLGLDLQELIGVETVAQVQALIATEAELRRLDTGLDRQQALTLLFSAKEALYKALYPRLRVFQEFDAVEATALEPAAIRLTLTRDWHARDWRAGQSIRVRHAWDGGQVLTACCLARDERAPG
ncbi:phosphopantetheinyltransferase component of enterobactin synthase multienzyme complex [Bordetella ansorpii]|uniref:Enterobactin synthase component D n=2 Tax=Bordetella ansorpii TaxID=288768 RepID=A0A157SKK4_9BORD|nr:phosphopantetheinyltransferase component of enterobactin synthase multienzyme complex [Bordetella ansorpii]